MKRILLITLTLAVATLLYACSDNPPAQPSATPSPTCTSTPTPEPTPTEIPPDGSIKLTIEKIYELAQKGNALTFDDLRPYEGKDIGSGLYIIEYIVEGDYRLMAGSLGITDFAYLRFYHVDDPDNTIDIRYDDINAFLNSKNQTESTE